MSHLGTDGKLRWNASAWPSVPDTNSKILPYSPRFKWGASHHTRIIRLKEFSHAVFGSFTSAAMNKQNDHCNTHPELPSGSLRFALALALLIWLAALTSGTAQAQELRLLTSPWPPSNYIRTDGIPAGISVDVIEAIKDRLKLETPVEVLPWARGYLVAQSDPNVLLFTAGRTPERVDMGFHFVGPVVMWTHALMARKGSEIAVDAVDAVRSQNLVVAGVRGSWQIRLLQDAGVQTVETENHETGARMLLAERVDLWITSRLQASSVLKDLGRDADSVTAIHTVKRSPSYLMISAETDPDIIARWEAAYEDLKQTDFFEKTVNKWSDQLGIALQFRPAEGFSARPAPHDKTGS
ncbi:polar amino acid transport system substrate-binding protein [Labrenzia sp. EL_159]|nr:polar amino acid transport system substrate-binding protein [Labrenzia sp. EL_162]MBG6195432.1 polar amino acid transport system substrate-binding protein [Labrenzia sp. EL_159]